MEVPVAQLRHSSSARDFRRWREEQRFLTDVGGWRVLAERFALMMIIAFGESIVAIGIGQKGPAARLR